MSIYTVLFDIGNVLTHDGHETYLTHKPNRLSENLGLSTQEILNKTAPVFRTYAVRTIVNETDFWNDMGLALGTSFSDKVIRNLKQELDDINTEAIAVFQSLKERGIAIGVISNCTPFFYASISKLLSLSTYVDPTLYFLSYEKGLLKSNGLFELAATKLDPSQTFIIDDRPKNVAHAKKLGFYGAQYSMKSGESLLALVTRIIRATEPLKA